ncbi:sirohydrochlorin chelatase [Pontibacillus yanchengensis]|uniref:Sirohydrochlorin chelatase n=2 Tax=Pontibacillus yanchengensis TaxID=462910 RepID=A0ACC7VI65_9BACI|nr:sirohydrochlorin chelatase [Pontibacillus yanchengensis]MYL34507.1 sirohydrochlorin chelatase [Pontibacillus yanchengensis]MYL54315.1 sirohydrochlorin chelatase [Pontibacillus yanchengensis]
MQAVLYVCHGSRVAKGRQQAVSFIEQCMETIDEPIQEVCFLELAQPTIEEGVQACIEQGATKVAVIPILLLSANHAKHDIPDELEPIKQAHPSVQFQYGAPFGVHERIVDILLERIHEQGTEPTTDDMILLVGRGSSDEAVKENFREIESYVKQKTNLHKVETCYLAAAHPTFAEGLEQAKASEAKRVFVVPYLLFTGILMQEMTEAIEELSSPQPFILCNYLGYHPNLREVLRDRVYEAIGA